MQKWMANYRERKKAEFFAKANSNCGRISICQRLLHPLLSHSYKMHEKELSLQRAIKAKKTEADRRRLNAEIKASLKEINEGIGKIDTFLRLQDKERMN